MPYLDPIIQDLIANAAGFIGPLQDAAKAADMAREAVDKLAASIAVLNRTGVDTAGSVGALGTLKGTLGDTRTALMGTSTAAGGLTRSLGNLRDRITNTIPAFVLLDSELAKKKAALAGLAIDTAAVAAALAIAAKAIDNTGKSAGNTTRIFGLTSNALHWIVMGSLEFLATAIPAVVAFTAAVMGMASAARSTMDSMRNLYVAAGGLRGALANSVPALQNVAARMGNLANAMKPNFMIIFGSAISIVGTSFGKLAGMAQQAGNVMSAFAAKLAAELAGPLGVQLQNAMANGVKYMIQWGQVIGNLIHAVLLIANAMYGWGQALLDVLNLLSRFLVVVASNWWTAQLIGIAALISGLYRWSTLLAVIGKWTGFSALMGGISVLIPKMWALVAVTGALITGQVSLDAAMETFWLVLGPVGAAILAITAIGALWYAGTRRQSDATAQLIATIQQLPPTIGNLSNGMLQLSQNLVSLQQQNTSASAAINQTGGVLTRLTGQLQSGGPAQTQYRNDVAATIAAMTQEAQQLIQVQIGLAQAGVRTGQLGAAQNQLAIQIAITDSQVQQLTQAMDQYLALVTGGASALAQFSQSMQNITTVSASQSKNLAAATGQMNMTVSQFATAMTSFAGQGAGAWNNFIQVVTGSMQGLLDWFHTAAAVIPGTGQQITSVTLDMISQLSQYASKNVLAQQFLLSVARAQGIQGVSTGNLAKDWAALSKMLPTAAKGFQDLQNRVIGTSIKLANLNQVAKNVAGALSTQVSQALATAALQASGFNTALAKLATDAANHTGNIAKDIAGVEAALQKAGKMATDWGQQVGTAGSSAAGKVGTSSGQMSAYTQATITKLQRLSNQVGTSADTAPRATGKISTMSSQMNAAIQTTIGKVGSLQTSINNLRGKTVTINVVTAYSTTGSPTSASASAGGGVPLYQHGTVLPGFAPGRDVVPAWLSPGESVLNPYATRMLGAGTVNWLNRVAESGRSVAPASLAAGAGGGGGQPIVVNVHSHAYLDGREVFSSVKSESYRYTTRNSGSRTGLMIPS